MKKIMLSSIIVLSFSLHGFSQLCDETAFPYIEGFESAQAPALPECTYSTYSTFASSEIFETSTGPIAGFNNKVAQYDTSSSMTGGVTANLFAGTLALTPGQSYNLSLRYAKSQTGNTASITINLLTPPDAGGFIMLAQQEIPDGINNLSLPFTVPAAGNYTISISVAAAPNSGFVYVDDIQVGVAGTMGIEDNTLNNLALYPNPSKNLLNISNDKVIETVALYNNMGQVLLSDEPLQTMHTLSLERFETGVYYVNVTSAGLTRQYKIVKE